MGRHGAPELAAERPQAPPPEHQPTGIVAAVVIAGWTAVLMFTFYEALADVHWGLALAVNAVAVGGMYPVVRSWRGRPVYRFLAMGLTVGVVLGWLAVVVVMFA